MRLSKGAATVFSICLVIAGLAQAQATSSSQKGGEIYKGKCAMCHGADGTGQTVIGKADKIRDLTSSEVQSQHDSELKNIIENGKGKMPAYKGKLTDVQVEQVVAYIRTLKK